MKDFIIKCDECGCDSHIINTENESVAQRILVRFHGWRVFPTYPDLLTVVWKRACKECVREYAVRLAIKRQNEKRVKDGQTR